MNSWQNESLGRLIYKTSLQLRNYAEKMLAPHGLTVEQYHLLKAVSPSNGHSQNELCQQLGKKPANITRILDRLEKKQWIERRAHPGDRRSSLIYLTGEGESVTTTVTSDFDSYSNLFIGGINADEERICRRVLEKIGSNLDTLMDEINK